MERFFFFFPILLTCTQCYICLFIMYLKNLFLALLGLFAACELSLVAESGSYSLGAVLVFLIVVASLATERRL